MATMELAAIPLLEKQIEKLNECIENQQCKIKAQQEKIKVQQEIISILENDFITPFRRKMRFLYLITRIARNTDGLHPTSKGIRLGQLLSKLRVIDGKTYDEVVMNQQFNSKDAVEQWFSNTISKLSEEQQDRLTDYVVPLIDQGKLRGDISEYLVSHFPELREQLIDLYL